MTKTLFISDLHLQESNPLIVRKFLNLLVSEEVDALYILGDLFEAWIGDDNDTAFHRQIIHALHSAIQSGLKIYFLHGNRDFLIGKKFLKATGCQLLKEETIVNIYGENVLLMHGDTLCTRDIAYLKWRKKARNPILHTLLFLILPLKWRRRFAESMRKKSEAHTQYAAREIMDVTQAEVERVMQKHGVNLLIHGHTHRPAIHHFKLDDHDATRIVLGAWHNQANILVWDVNGKKELVDWCRVD